MAGSRAYWLPDNPKQAPSDTDTDYKRIHGWQRCWMGRTEQKIGGDGIRDDDGGPPNHTEERRL